MTDQQMQKKLDQLVRIANELDDEAKRRYGPYAALFFESEGTFYVMRNDVEGTPTQRQQFVTAQSKGHCKMGAGAW